MNNFQSFFDTLSRGRATAPSKIDEASQSADLVSTAAARRESLSPSQSSSQKGGGSADGEQASGVIRGIEIDKAVFTFSNPREDEDLPTPQCTPIAIYQSESVYGSGRLLAVSDTYICYAIKLGHIRVINRQSVQRTLLKGHTKPVIDLSFSKTSSTLASIARDGSLFLWTIGEMYDESKGIVGPKSTILGSIQGLNLQRLVWHPSSSVIALVQDGDVALVDAVSLIKKLQSQTNNSLTTSNLTDLDPMWKFTAHSNTQILDLSFSQDGRYLVTGGAAGWARVWDVESRNAVARWQPYGGEAVSRVLFLHRSSSGPSSGGEKIFIVTGGKTNAEVKLWKAWTTLAPINTQTLTFEESDGRGSSLHVDASESGDFLIITDFARPLLYVAHVVLGPSNAKVDRLTPFKLKHPVLSLLTLSGVAMDAHEGQADRSGAAEVQVYCIQTHAIQIYHLKPSDCSQGPTRPPPTPATAKKAEEGGPPTILNMLLQANQTTSTTGGLISPPPALMTAPSPLPPPIAGSRTVASIEDQASTQSVAAALSEEKQAGGAHTTEEGILAGRSGRALAGSAGKTTSVKPTQILKREGPGGGGGEGIVSGQASRDSSSSSSSVVVDEKGVGGGQWERQTEIIASSARQAVVEALAGLAPDLQKKVDKAVKTAVAGQMESLNEKVSNTLREAALGLGEAVKEPVTTSFKQQFQELLIPAIQTATQRMFAQMNDALNRGLADRSASDKGGVSDAALLEIKSEVSQVRNEVAALTKLLQGLSSQLENGGGLGSGESRLLGTKKQTTLKAGGSEAISSSLREELRKQLRAGRFGDAFQKALGAGDLELVTWLCSEAPKDDIFDADPPLLSQAVLLCLMQQLSFNLGRQTSLKLDWLKQISLVFNPQDPEVIGFLQSVLGQLQTNLEQAAAEIVALGDQEMVKDFKFVQRAVKKMI